MSKATEWRDNLITTLQREAKLQNDITDTLIKQIKTEKAKTQGLVKLIEKHFPANSGHKQCVCPTCNLYKNVKQIMEGKNVL
jgi:hypothetical protein